MEEDFSSASGVQRQLGWARGEFTVPEDFDAPLPVDVEDGFYQSDETLRAKLR